MAITLLEKKTGIVSDLQQAVFNRISTDAQDGYVEGYLNEFAITKLSANSLSVDTGMVSLQGFRVVNDTITNVYVGVSAATPIDMELVAKLTIVLASENNNVELIARPSQTPTQDNVFAQGEGVYEAVLASFVVDQNGIRDIKRGIGKIDIEQSDIKEIEKQMALKADKAALAITDANVALKADKTSLDVTNTLLATKADQKDLEATNTLVATKADQKDLDATNTLVATKVDKTALEAVKLINVTWQELKDLRDSSALVPGRQYRITDYVTTTAQENTRSAGHQFDIIVTADDVDVLNENARAVQHEGDTYFANSKLEAWKLKYCLDNDTSRFAWADEVNGKGVIYRMIDEFNNDCPYDFKNIQFKRKLRDGVYDPVSGEETWVYTFTLTALIDGDIVDISLKQNTEYPDEDGQYYNCSFNTIKEATLVDGLIRLKLNDNVFLNVFDNNDTYSYYGCYSNTFGNNCYSNTFGNECYNNTFGNNCKSNAFGTECHSNTFGNSCSYNTFGDDCYYNTFGYSCRSNTFETECYNNTFGNGCSSNTFGNGCSSNTFETECYSNTFGNSCSSNTFGDGCYGNTFGTVCRYNTFGAGCFSNTFGNSCSSNTFGNSCRYNTFGASCSYNTFGDDCFSNTFGNSCRYNTFGNSCYYDKITGDYVGRLNLDNGIQGASDANKLELYDLKIVSKAYQVTFKKSASGRYLMLWATDTGAMTGKYKALNTDATWTAL